MNSELFERRLSRRSRSRAIQGHRSFCGGRVVIASRLTNKYRSLLFSTRHTADLASRIFILFPSPYSPIHFHSGSMEKSSISSRRARPELPNAQADWKLSIHVQTSLSGFDERNGANEHSSELENKVDLLLECFPSTQRGSYTSGSAAIIDDVGKLTSAAMPSRLRRPARRS